MHQLFYVASSAREVRDFYLDRLRTLRDEGFHVVVAAPFSEELERLQDESFSIRPLPGAHPRNFPGQLGALAILQGEFLQSPPTLVHGFGRPWAYIACAAAHRAGVAAVFSTIERHRTSRRRSRKAYSKLGHWATRYLVHHEHELEELVALNLVPKAKLELVVGGRGIDLAAFAPAEATTGVTADRRFSILARDGAAERKAQQWLMRRVPNAEWSFGLATAQSLASADLYFSADEDDFVGDALMAAAAMRTPVLSAASPAAKSVVVQHETGRVVPTNDLPAELQRMLSDPRRLNEMGIRARARAEVRFDRSKIDDQVIRLYDRVLSERMR